jgi:hypothetical protein
VPVFDDLEQTHQPEQLDLLLVKDTLQAADRLLKRCASDLGDRYLADLIDRTPSTVHNQLDGSDPNKTPSFALAIATAMTHQPFRRALCKLLCPPPTLEPVDGIAEIERDVLPDLGAADSKKLRAILRRVKR